MIARRDYAINIGMKLCNQPGIRSYLIGGVVARARSFSLTGSAALNFLDDVYMDKVFLCVTGLDAERGTTKLETDEAQVVRKMLKLAPFEGQGIRIIRA